MLEPLRAAIAEAAWGEALVVALAWWRETRATELADLIDVLGARCPMAAPARREHQAWWMLHATTYNAAAISALVATAETRAARSDRTWADILSWYPGNPVIDRVVAPHSQVLEKRRWVIDQSNRVERLAAMAVWPDDPRTATILAAWFVEAEVNWQVEAAADEYYTLIAQQLVAIGDARVDERLAQTVVEPRGKSPRIRTLQIALARQVIAEVAARPRALEPGDREQLARWQAALAPVAEGGDDREAALWDEIERAPDDPAPRMVLADYLAEHGDPRGELFVMQRTQSGRPLIREHWGTWLGDAGLVLDQGQCEWRDGMLEVACVGTISTPDWAWDKAPDHRELVAVRTVRPGRVTPERYVEFLLGLRRMPHTVGITHAIAEAMRPRSPWPIRAVTLRYYRSIRTPRLEQTFEVVAAAIPELESIVIGIRNTDGDEARAVVPRLAELFPKLARVELVAKAWRWLGATRAELAAVPVV